MNKIFLIWIYLQCLAIGFVRVTGHAQESGAPSVADSENIAADKEAVQTTRSDQNQSPALSTSSSSADKQMRLAKPYIIRGEKLFGERNYDAALPEFEKAHEILKGHPKQYQTLYNIGLCHERSFRYDQALRYYKKYLKQCPADDKRRSIVEATIETLQGLLATLRVQINVKVEIWVDDRFIGHAPSEILVPGGRHTVEFRAEGYEAYKKELQIPARSEQTIEIRLKKIKEYQGLHPIFFWSGAALTVASFSVGAYFGIKAIDKDGMFGEKDPNYNPDVKKEIDNLALTADILYGVGSVLTIGTVLLYFMSDFGEDTDDKTEERVDKAKVRAECSPIIDRNQAGIQIRGLF